MNLGKVFLTGGTGSFGRAFTKKLIELNNFTQLIVFSRDELKQFELANEIKSPKVIFVLGDVRDYDRLSMTMRDSDVVVHAAAMKQIPASENNPIEAIKTNVLGADNIVNASIACGIKKVIALSTDKAANPANLYGATKLCSDKLMIAGNSALGNNTTKISVVRYGNVLGSRGSVIPFFREQSNLGVIPITDPKMTRFWLTIEEGVEFVLKSFERMQGGEIFVPKIPSFKVIDVAKVVAPDVKTEIIGIRPGEKLHEVMITEDDSIDTVEFDKFYAILSPLLKKSEYYKKNGRPVNLGFRYTSDNNQDWHTHESFKSILIENNLLQEL
jgi:UDP-N-acetylglucosamine 4,6-dehydratase